MIADNLIRKVLEASLGTFFDKEADQILRNVSERNLCGRLAHFLQDEANAEGLGEYIADPDYNRKQDGRVKTIINGQTKIVQITCDLVLHLRGKRVENDNLIAVEMKKSYRYAAEKADDKDRIIALTKPSYDNIWSYDGVTHPEHVCGYRLGVYIELDRKKRHALIEYYSVGKCFDVVERKF